jgi:hypothetical protein
LGIIRKLDWKTKFPLLRHIIAKYLMNILNQQ